MKERMAERMLTEMQRIAAAEVTMLKHRQTTKKGSGLDLTLMAAAAEAEAEAEVEVEAEAVEAPELPLCKFSPCALFLAIFWDFLGPEKISVWLSQTHTRKFSDFSRMSENFSGSEKHLRLKNSTGKKRRMDLEQIW
ncbi:unnamed protein product [Camellia sinensis]